MIKKPLQNAIIVEPLSAEDGGGMGGGGMGGGGMGGMDF